MNATNLVRVRYRLVAVAAILAFGLLPGGVRLGPNAHR